jgi:DNA-binding NarL/FixJ family response regulator
VKNRIFLIDDHPVVRQGLATLLNQQSDLEVCGEADDAVGALAAIAAAKPDVALVDLSLKTSSGLELVKDLVIQHPTVRVVVLSMYDELIYAERVVRAGASGYVMKRETNNNLLAAIRRVTAGGVFLSDRVMTMIAEKMGAPKRLHGASIVDQLSDRELEVFRLMGRGRSTSQIAEEMHISIKTVQAYHARMKEKLGLTNATELLRAAVRWEAADEPA